MLKVVSNARGDAETGEWSVQEREISFNVCPTYVTNIEFLPDWFTNSRTKGCKLSSVEQYFLQFQTAPA